MRVILISQDKEFDNKRLNLIKRYAKVNWIKKDKINLKEVKELFNPDEKILALSPVPLNWTLPKDIYKKFRNVKYICVPTTGYDFIDLNECKKFNIKITSVPYYSTNAVAEYAIFLMVALHKKLAVQIKKEFRYEFSQETLMDEFRNKSVGIVGLGHIGNRIAELTINLGMKTYYWSRKNKNNKFTHLELEELLSTVDVVFPTLIVNNDTSKILTTNLLSKVKTTSYVIDVTHGLTDPNYLIKKVEQNKLAGYAFESDKLKIKNFKGNVLITSPLAWFTKQSLENNIQIWAETIISCLKGKPKNLV